MTREINTDAKGITYIRVSKMAAEKMYNVGYPVYVMASNMIFENPWVAPYRIKKQDIEENPFTMGSSFREIVSDFMYYNCDQERGRYVKYYVKYNDYMCFKPHK